MYPEIATFFSPLLSSETIRNPLSPAILPELPIGSKSYAFGNDGIAFR